MDKGEFGPLRPNGALVDPLVVGSSTTAVGNETRIGLFRGMPYSEQIQILDLAVRRRAASAPPSATFASGSASFMSAAEEPNLMDPR